MNDTDPRILKRISEMFREKSSLERLKMGAGMFDMARAIVKSSLRSADESVIRAGLFMRFYGNEYNSSQKKRILEYLRNVLGRQTTKGLE